MTKTTRSYLKESPRQKTNDQTKRRNKGTNRQSLADPPSPQQGSSAIEGRPWPSLADAGARPLDGRPPVKAGDPLSGPRQPFSSTLSQASKSLECQTTSSSYENSTSSSFSQIASHRLPE